jgi:hypothetical protein
MVAAAAATDAVTGVVQHFGKVPITYFLPYTKAARMACHPVPNSMA